MTMVHPGTVSQNIGLNYRTEQYCQKTIESTDLPTFLPSTAFLAVHTLMLISNLFLTYSY